MITYMWGYLALVTFGTVVNAETLLDNSMEEETTSQASPASSTPCGREGAGGEEGAGALASAIHQVAQEALRLQERRAATALRRLEQRLQERDGALRALLDERLQRLQEAVAESAAELASKLAKLEAAVGDPSSEPLAPPSPTEATETDAEARQRVEQRVREYKIKVGRHREPPSPLGEELCVAANTGRLDGVQRLLDSGAHVNHTCAHLACSPLMAAFYLDKEGSANPEVVSLLLERGAAVDAIDVFGATALHSAAAYDSRATGVALLLSAGADVDARDQDGATPLHWAAHKGNAAAVRALLAAGAHKGLRGWRAVWKRRTAFDLAASADLQDILDILRPDVH